MVSGQSGGFVGLFPSSIYSRISSLGMDG